MKSIGVVICNYNKKDYVLQCIQAVLESTITDYDIYVVDNASTDGSVRAIQEQYGSAVSVICNETNLGGSGGFNTGLRLVIDKGYPYICCLDNDALLDENALVEMRDFLQKNKRVGMVGAEIFHMHDPSRIQQFGLKIDFEKYQTSSYYFDEIENETIPQVMYCDTVPACAVMLPLEVVKEVGVMPEDNFIYWDDTEWGFLVKQAGYQVAAIASAKALHEMGSLQKKMSTFTQYYMWRNRIHFFLKYAPDSDAEQMSISLLSAVFQEIFEAMYKGEQGISQTITMAYKDALEGVRGKAQEGRIVENNGNHIALKEFFAQYHSAQVLGDVEWVKAVFEVLSIPVIVNDDANLPDIKIQTCESVLYLAEVEPDIVYFDQNLCILTNKQDAELLSHYQFGLGMFLYMNQRRFLEAKERISKE